MTPQFISKFIAERGLEGFRGVDLLEAEAVQRHLDNPTLRNKIIRDVLQLTISLMTPESASGEALAAALITSLGLVLAGLPDTDADEIMNELHLEALSERRRIKRLLDALENIGQQP